MPLPVLIRACAFALAFLVLGATPAGSQSPAPAPLVFQNREIIVFRATLLGHSPEERAEGALGRLQRVAREPGEKAVSVRAMEVGNAIELDGTAVFFVTNGDVNTLLGDTLESTTQRAVASLSLALVETREARDFSAIARASALVAAATALFLLLLWIVMRATRWLAVRLLVSTRTLVGHVRIGAHAAIPPEPVARSARAAVVAFGWLAGLFLAYIWLAFSLERFPYTRPWGEQLERFLFDVLATVAGGIAGAIPGLVFVVIIVVITRALTRVVGAFLNRVEAGRVTIGWLDSDTAAPTRRILNVALWLFALAMAYPYLPGSDSEAFKGLSVLVGLMVTIGASGIVGQAASGLILVYSRALRQGEYVRIAETEGTVTQLGMFSTHIRTGLGEEVVLPNAFIVANPTRNYSRVVPGSRGFVLDTQVTIGYSTPWRQVHAMLLEAARRTPGMLSEPKPFVVQTALSDFYVEYRLVCCAGPEAPQRRALVLDALHANIQDVFNEHRVQIMSPHYMTDPEHAQIVPKEKWYESPAQPPGR